MKYTKEVVEQYIMGWSLAGTEEFTKDTIKSILKNSLVMLDDENDGIENFARIKSMYDGAQSTMNK